MLPPKTRGSFDDSRPQCNGGATPKSPKNGSSARSWPHGIRARLLVRSSGTCSRRSSAFEPSAFPHLSYHQRATGRRPPSGPPWLGILRRKSMRSDIDDLAEDTLFALEEETDRPSGGGWGLPQAQGNLVAAPVALGNARAGRDVETQIELARVFLRQAVQHQSGLSSSTSRALATIRRRDLGGALAIVRGMYRLVRGGAA